MIIVSFIVTPFSSSILVVEINCIILHSKSNYRKYYMTVFTLEELKDTITLFSIIQADFWSENCIVALEHNSHKTGCILNVTGDQAEDIELKWSMSVVKNGYKEEKKFIEKSAEAISFFLCRKYTEYNVIEESCIGTGVDYWLGYDETHQSYDPSNFLSARLEISGINAETPTNTVASRTKVKTKQAGTSDGTALPAYISIVEHSTPKAHFIKK